MEKEEISEAFLFYNMYRGESSINVKKILAIFRGTCIPQSFLCRTFEFHQPNRGK